jgi:hypothetical protein
MKLMTALSVLALSFSTTARADLELGGFAGYNVQSAKVGDSLSGPAVGLRAGMGVGLGLTPEIIIARISTGTIGGDESQMNTQIKTGLGLRFYVGDFFLRPFASAHLNYAMAVETPDGQSVPDSAATEFDIGAGIQLKFLDLIYTELQGSYSRSFNEAETANMYGGIGFGVKL